MTKTRIGCWLAFLSIVAGQAMLWMLYPTTPTLQRWPTTATEIAWLYGSAYVAAGFLIWAYRHRHDAP
jgi:hypothetical protein